MRSSASTAAAVAVGVCALAVCVMVSAMPHGHRQLLQTANRLTTSCALAAARQCSSAQSQCLSNLPVQDQNGICQCYEMLGNCLHNAGCLNGTYEDLHTQYCQSGDSYCCNGHGEFNGCGERSDFIGSEMCLCESSYTGTFCNTTDVMCSSGDDCNVCGACCKDYSRDTCEGCVAEECNSVCSADSSCTVCSACCKSYLSGPSAQADCNICVQEACPTSSVKKTWAK